MIDVNWLNSLPINEPVPPDRATGLVPRNYKALPVGSMVFAQPMPDSEIIDEAEWPERLAENRAKKAGLLDLREANYDILKSLDQDGLGLCWAFSSTKAMMYWRILCNLTGLRLSAWWVAGRVVNWQDRGYWGSASLAQIAKEGVPTEALCPSYKSSYDTAETRADAAKRKCTEWWDGSDSPDKATKQLVSQLLRGCPCVVDLNDMGHSMCAIDIASLNPLKIVYDNSWGESDNKGLYIGQGARARPDGLVIPRSTMIEP